MKGVIFNLLGEVVWREYGQDARDALLDAAELSGNDTSLASYPDNEIARFARVAATLALPAVAVSRVRMFDYDTSGEDRLLMGYRALRRLCALPEGFIEGATAHHGHEIALQQSSCMPRGDDKRISAISFTKRTG